jgi:hypothetical protein
LWAFIAKYATPTEITGFVDVECVYIIINDELVPLNC